MKTVCGRQPNGSSMPPETAVALFAVPLKWTSMQSSTFRITPLLTIPLETSQFAILCRQIKKSADTINASAGRKDRIRIIGV